MNIIFDLDGTLIDSSDGILKALEMAFKKCKQPLLQPLTTKLVGPPLNKLLPILAGTDNVVILNDLTIAFKDSYDSEGYKDSTVFDGVRDMLQELQNAGFTLYLATNKRIVPTRKIMHHFGWNKFFTGIYALDLFPDLSGKAELIKHIIQIHQLDTDSSIYVGDTIADQIASQENGIECLLVSWGYGDVELGIDSIKTLTTRIKEWHR